MKWNSWLNTNDNIILDVWAVHINNKVLHLFGILCGNAVLWEVEFLLVDKYENKRNKTALVNNNVLFNLTFGTLLKFLD